MCVLNIHDISKQFFYLQFWGVILLESLKKMGIYGATFFGSTIFGVTIYGIIQCLQTIYCRFGEFYVEDCGKICCKEY